MNRSNILQTAKESNSELIIFHFNESNFRHHILKVIGTQLLNRFSFYGNTNSWYELNIELHTFRDFDFNK